MWGLSHSYPSSNLGFRCSQRSIYLCLWHPTVCSLLLPPQRLSGSFAGSSPLPPSKSGGAAEVAFFSSLLVLHSWVITASWFSVILPCMSSGRSSPTRPAAHLTVTAGMSTSTCPKRDSSSYSPESILPSLPPLSAPASPAFLTQHTILGIFSDTSLFPSSPLPLQLVSRSCIIDLQLDHFFPPPPLPFWGQATVVSPLEPASLQLLPWPPCALFPTRAH